MLRTPLGFRHAAAHRGVLSHRAAASHLKCWRFTQEARVCSAVERALFTACEFWTAVCSRKLALHLGMPPLNALRYASILYAALGAHAVADDMVRAIGELKRASHPLEQHQYLTKLQERLLRTRDPVDQLKLTERSDATALSALA
jgi:hypothetical protein